MMEAAWPGPARTGARPDWMVPLRPDDRRQEVRRVGHPGPGRLERGARAGGPGECRSAAKREPGNGLFVGGVTLPQALADLGLIDEYESRFEGFGFPRERTWCCRGVPGNGFDQVVILSTRSSESGQWTFRTVTRVAAGAWWTSTCPSIRPSHPRRSLDQCDGPYVGKYGVAFFEDRRERGMNANFTIEVGCMLMAGRRWRPGGGTSRSRIRAPNGWREARLRRSRTRTMQGWASCTACVRARYAA
jgi:hypothetical protein